MKKYFEYIIAGIGCCVAAIGGLLLLATLSTCNAQSPLFVGSSDRVNPFADVEIVKSINRLIANPCSEKDWYVVTEFTSYVGYMEYLSDDLVEELQQVLNQLPEARRAKLYDAISESSWNCRFLDDVDTRRVIRESMWLL